MLLTKLPAELRLKIYQYLFEPEDNLHRSETDGSIYDFKDALTILGVNRQIYHEARKVFTDLNTLIRVRTPWEQTVVHVMLRQQVPIVARDIAATKLVHCSMNIDIDAPAYQNPTDDPQQFILHLNDLDKFTRQWMYSELSYEINTNLRVRIELDSPYTPSYEAKQVPKALQRRLLLPFGEVKRLCAFEMRGSLRPFQSIEKELLKAQAIPYKNAEQCLREAAKSRNDGNVELQAKRYEQAIQHYFDSFHAMHIIIAGRDRHIHGERFFNRIMMEEPYKNLLGESARLLLRAELVANVCVAYYELKNYEMCTHWGWRSIIMLRQSFQIEGSADLRPETESSMISQMAEVRPFFGRIYDYTARAFNKQGESSTAKKLWLVARLHLPGERERIDEDIEACRG